MGALKRAVAVYLVGLAVVVAVNFAVAPLYHPPGAETYPVWEVLNWFQAVSVLIALAVHTQRKRALDGGEDGPVTRGYVAVNLSFYGAVVLTIWYFSNWFAALFPHEPAMAAQAHMNMWGFINALVVIVTGGAGVHLWRAAARQT